ncbi:hypothetical protein ASA1KI_33370 [Opitutales bacterium ASA1]|uniref:hypothetical protein n=1 Tax=Congregicoccus parvus TaxID=3081749 RepID=UPI002B31EFC9|nr:hypothetical protein ASA1KI_33370 [Opitutales bacterium ASA1]
MTALASQSSRALRRLACGVTLLAVLVFPAVISSAAEPPSRPELPAEVRQFDFWLGHWEVTTPDGAVVGTNRIERILDGRVLQENWTGADGHTGKSFNLFDATVGKWRQFWVDASGLSLQLAGSLVHGAMVLEGDRLQDGKRLRDRITWTPNADGSVRQLWEISRDAGASWSTIFDGLYRKKPTA